MVKTSPLISDVILQGSLVIGHNNHHVARAIERIIDGRPEVRFSDGFRTQEWQLAPADALFEHNIGEYLILAWVANEYIGAQIVSSSRVA